MPFSNDDISGQSSIETTSSSGVEELVAAPVDYFLSKKSISSKNQISKVIKTSDLSNASVNNKGKIMKTKTANKKNRKLKRLKKHKLKNSTSTSSTINNNKNNSKNQPITVRYNKRFKQLNSHNFYDNQINRMTKNHVHERNNLNYF